MPHCSRQLRSYPSKLGSKKTSTPSPEEAKERLQSKPPKQTSNKQEQTPPAKGKRDVSETVKLNANSLSLSCGLVQEIVAPVARR